MTQIVVLDGFTENPGDLSWAGLEALGQLRVYPRTKPEEVIPRIGQADIVYTNKTPITRETLLACPSIRMVSVLATGYNVVDVAACQELGILVTNIPTYGTTAVAQFTMALLLEICHRVGHHSQAVRQGRWSSSPDWCFWDYPLMELAGKTLGIIGMGRIGQAVARIAQAMGMEILAYDAHPCDAGLALADYVPLDALLARSHVISLHCPLFPETQGIINRDTIAKMRDGVILLNTSRGPLVVEADLAAALQAGKVYAAGLDVVSSEPIAPDNPLLQAPNCFITPHIAWAPRESRQRLMDIAVENCAAFLRGAPQNLVRP